MKLKINIKYILMVSLTINCLIIGRCLSNKLSPRMESSKIVQGIDSGFIL